jgi:hypothetical protein
MRITRLLATCAMAWALSISVPWAHFMSDAAASGGEISMCLVPMASPGAPLGPCSDHTSPWVGVEGLLNPD